MDKVNNETMKEEQSLTKLPNWFTAKSLTKVERKYDVNENEKRIRNLEEGMLNQNFVFYKLSNN